MKSDRGRRQRTNKTEDGNKMIKKKRREKVSGYQSSSAPFPTTFAVIIGVCFCDCLCLRRPLKGSIRLSFRCGIVARWPTSSLRPKSTPQKHRRCCCCCCYCWCECHPSVPAPITPIITISINGSDAMVNFLSTTTANNDNNDVVVVVVVAIMLSAVPISATFGLFAGRPTKQNTSTIARRR